MYEKADFLDMPDMMKLRLIKGSNQSHLKMKIFLPSMIEEVILLRKTEWSLCPICDRKMHNKIKEDIKLKNFPIYCPKCNREMVVDVEQFIVSVCKGKAK